MDVKNLTASIKAAGDGLTEGQIIAYASIFDNVDSYGDVVVKGAFAKTLQEWADSGAPIPLLFAHNMSDPDYNIGAVLEAEEDEKGLKITAELDLDAPKAAQVYRLIKAGRVRELSFAFDVVKSAYLDDEERPKAYRELQELKLYECSIVPIGANPETEILAVKSAVDALKAGAVSGLKVGRALSTANETKLRDVAGSMKSAAALIDDVLSSVVSDDEKSSTPITQEKSSGHGPTPGEPTAPAGKSGFNPSDPLVAEFDFIATPTEE